MNTKNPLPDQDNFVKALSDENRLKVIGVLAEGNASASDLSARTQLHPAQVARHLEVLLQAGIIKTTQTGTGLVYELDTSYVEAVARQTLAASHKKVEFPVDKYSEEEQKILRGYVRSDGCLSQMPLQSKKIQVISKYVYEAFEKERRYTEKEVNEVLSRFHPDTSTLRRFLVDYQFLGRERDGSVYWCLK